MPKAIFRGEVRARFRGQLWGEIRGQIRGQIRGYMDYLDHIRRCNAYDLDDFLPWIIAGRRVGYIHRDFALRLRDFPDVFEVQDRAVLLCDVLGDVPGERSGERPGDQSSAPDARSDAVESVLVQLRAEGGEAARRNEPYAVTDRIGGEVLMVLDRSAASRFGIITTGFHLNGTVETDGGTRMWIARRARDRITFPGCLDNMVAGGQSATISPADNVLKECREEADIPADLARHARPVGLISYNMQVSGQVPGQISGGLRRHVMYLYDLDLPRSFEPRPFDGEVESFGLMEIDAVAELVRSGLDAFKYNCSLAVIDYLVRHGHIAPDRPDYFDLVTGLRRPIV